MQNDNLFKWTLIIIALCSIISIVCIALLFWKYHNVEKQLEQPRMLMPWTPDSYNDKGEPTVNGWVIK